MTIYNQDGSLSASCGNGTRCVAHYLAGLNGPTDLRLATSAGPLAVRGSCRPPRTPARSRARRASPTIS